ncbi:flavin monoamine oxidase family protein [Leifsonia sp. YAF41]|uniref:flavin monoamine oxidase family protein n=1 Tax=Leifsonia sp. YAF41 TaxID=3233086 RepID=UPI003F96CCC3
MPARNGNTPLTGSIQRIFAAHRVSENTGIPVDEVLEREPERGELTRRSVLKGATILGAAGLVSVTGDRLSASAATTAGSGNNVPSVVIVGAGLAGVRAAHWLYTVKGVRSTIYEGNTRAGGRCYSLTNYFDDGAVVEHGGAFINTDHNATRNLANSLGLTLKEANGGSYGSFGDKYYIDGANYLYSTAKDDWASVWQTFKSALQSAPATQTFDNHTAAGVAIDNMTVNEWIAGNIPGGLSSKFGKLMQSNVIAEYGLDPDQQSALNLIYLLGWNTQSALEPINGADERFIVEGGNDQIVAGMIAELPAGTIQYGKKLVAVKTLSNGSVTCSFQSGNTISDVNAGKVILALPFTTLRDCDLSQSGFSALKKRAISEMDLGANAKLHVQVSSRPWVAQGYGGSSYTNISGYQCGWDDTAATSTTKGVFNFFPGGRQVTSGWTGQPFGPGSATQVAAYLAQVEPVFPGMTAAYTGKSYRDVWHLNPWSKGSYTCPKPGQYTSLFGVATVRSGNVHFAGEHTSVDFFGFLNGAVESGERAGREVVGIA